MSHASHILLDSLLGAAPTHQCLASRSHARKSHRNTRAYHPSSFLCPSEISPSKGVRRQSTGQPAGRRPGRRSCRKAWARKSSQANMALSNVSLCKHPLNELESLQRMPAMQARLLGCKACLELIGLHGALGYNTQDAAVPQGAGV